MINSRRAGNRLRPVVRRGRWRVDYQGRYGTNSRWFRTRKEAFADYWTHLEAEIYDEGTHTPNAQVDAPQWSAAE